MLRKTVLLVLLLALVGCVTTGPKGKKSFIFISTSQEVDIGKQVAADVESKERVLGDSQVQSYVNNIGQKLVSVCDRKDIRYSFKVLDNDEINAFACPGGFIYVYKGLLKTMNSEAELAAVLGHEIAHVVARHSIKKLQQVYGISLLIKVALGEKGKAVQNVVGAAVGLVLMGYGRDNEFEADEYGTLYQYGARYNPDGMVQLLGLFKSMEKNPPGTLEKLLSTHPPTSERITRVEKQVDGFGEGAKSLPYGESEYAAIKARL
ncbi:peptidase M48 [candidate division TA06 bacterium]|uniref:Peptidase M48 n=1 Tax=candidate division TA06 bacterium TaxID=2250710 RepID=A0A523XL82_UNCT6|nr:MAG: peptidase M48 [candidate division TA06 bacterium]